MAAAGNPVRRNDELSTGMARDVLGILCVPLSQPLSVDQFFSIFLFGA